jgi:hypothetical protein
LTATSLLVQVQVQVESLAARGRGVTERESFGVSEPMDAAFFVQLQWKRPPHHEIRMNDDSQARPEYENESENRRISSLDLRPHRV